MDRNHEQKKEYYHQLFADNKEGIYAYNILKDTTTPVFLTGKAGTGKSTFIKLAETLFSPVLKVAPTGIAALNIQGDTINSIFHLPHRLCMPTDEFIDSIRFREEDRLYLSAVELVIVDEISMVCSATLDCMDRILRHVCNKDLPFGGKRVLMVGDVFQLAPIVKKDELSTLMKHYKSEYFFDSTVFQQMTPVKIELQKNYRQKDSKFLDILDSIRSRSNLFQSLCTLNKACVKPAVKTTENSITLAFKNEEADDLNYNELNKLPAESHYFKAIVKGKFEWASVIAEKHLELRNGARIMMIKNHCDGLYVNGTIGVVKEIAEDCIWVKTDEGKLIAVTRETWFTLEHKSERIKNGWQRGYEEVGSMRQYPLKLAWAITVHKSQGLTFDQVYLLNRSTSFAPGQTYVALSRCRSLEGLRLLNRLERFDIKVSPIILEFYKSINEKKE